MDESRGEFTDADAFDDIKAEEYRYWQSRPVYERLARVCELSLEKYGMKGQPPPKIDKTLIRVERPPKCERTS